MSGFLAMKAAGEAKADGMLSPSECEIALTSEEDVLIIDLRDSRDSVVSSAPPPRRYFFLAVADSYHPRRMRLQWVAGSVSASLGTLAFKADSTMPAEFKDPLIADRNKASPVIVTCALGGQAAIGAGMLKVRLVRLTTWVLYQGCHV